MTIQPLSIPIYKLVCPACEKEFLEPLVKVIAENFTHCPSCHEHITAATYYNRAKVVELAKTVGYNREDFISVND